MTASTGTASRSRSCSPRRRNRPTTRRALIRVTYEEQNPVTSLAAAKAKGTESGLFMGEPLKQKVGDAEAALAAAPHKVDVTYTTPRHHHAPIELHACTLAWEGDTLRIHDASQAVAHEAWTIAQVFGLKENQVRLTSPFVGGGFGSKLLWQHQILAAAAAKLARPAGADHALPRGGVPHRRRPHRHRAARGAWRPG